MAGFLAAGIVVIIILLFVSAFLSGSETALTAVSPATMHRLEQHRSRAARCVNRLLSDRERMIGAILLGNTFINILVSSLATSLLAAHYGSTAVVITTVVMTFVVLVFAEVLPKTLAIARTDRFALSVGRILVPVVSLLGPIVGAVQFVVWRLLRLFGVREESEGQPVLPPHEEIRGAVELAHREGGVQREHRNMLGGILDLRELSIGDVAIHRKNIIAVDADQSPAKIFEEVMAARHTRVPIWRETPDNIVGVLRTADVMRDFARRRGLLAGWDILSLMEDPWFVPDTTTLEEQVRAFRRQRRHFALVVDEYGALQGVITLTDIVEEILGGIPDERATSEPAQVRPQADGSYLVEGTTPLRELNRVLDWHFPDEDATTIAGLIIHEARTIPEIGQRFAFYGFKFEIVRRQRNQITLVRVMPPPKTENGTTEN
ncbi:MAG TPA: HlyC/CorC family transporter [Rhizomicrobium sp.]|jgi:Mg2+/Co2+ transporter CorB|nr:HlyC/CorC family transporter [Rhizomicrobium sp.]